MAKFNIIDANKNTIEVDGLIIYEDGAFWGIHFKFPSFVMSHLETGSEIITGKSILAVVNAGIYQMKKKPEFTAKCLREKIEFLGEKYPVNKVPVCR